jgi:hypothetical protein
MKEFLVRKSQSYVITAVQKILGQFVFLLMQRKHRIPIYWNPVLPWQKTQNDTLPNSAIAVRVNLFLPGYSNNDSTALARY